MFAFADLCCGAGHIPQKEGRAWRSAFWGLGQEGRLEVVLSLHCSPSPHLSGVSLGPKSLSSVSPSEGGRQRPPGFSWNGAHRLPGYPSLPLRSWLQIQLSGFALTTRPRAFQAEMLDSPPRSGLLFPLPYSFRGASGDSTVTWDSFHLPLLLCL